MQLGNNDHEAHAHPLIRCGTRYAVLHQNAHYLMPIAVRKSVIFPHLIAYRRGSERLQLQLGRGRDTKGTGTAVEWNALCNAARNGS